LPGIPAVDTLADVILYTNPDRKFAGEAYDATYAQSPDRFGHGITFRALGELFASQLALDRPIRAIDLGCGQGQVISYVHEKLRERSPAHADASDLFGLDISEVAIRQCEQRNAHVNWIVDTFQEFLARSETQPLNGTFDLIINKGGLTQVGSEDEYRAMLEGTRDLLREGGLYLFIQYKQFYQVWSNAHCLDWNTDIFELGAQMLGEPLVIDDDSAYICVYRKGRQCAAKEPQRTPRRVHFTMNDGSEQRVFISGDELMSKRLHRVRATPDRESFFAFDLPSDATEKEVERHTQRVQAARDAFVPGRQRVLLGTGRVRMTDAKAIDPESTLFDALSDQFNVVAWPGMISTVRHLCKVIAKWSLARPDDVVIGPGLEDYKLDPATHQPIVDADEFRYRLDWVLDVLTNEAGANAVYLATPPTANFVDERNGYVYRPDAAQPFLDAAMNLCREHGATFRDLQQTKALKRSNVLPAVATCCAEMVHARKDVACAR